MNNKNPVHLGKDHVDRINRELQRTQTRSLKQIAAAANRADARAENAERRSSGAWRVSVVAVVIAALSLLVDILKLAFGV